MDLLAETSSTRVSGQRSAVSSIAYKDSPQSHIHTHRPAHASAFPLLLFHCTNGDQRSADTAGNLSVGAGRRGGVRGAAVAGRLDTGVGVVDATAARPSPTGPGPQGHQVPPPHRRREGERPAQPRSPHEAAGAWESRHHPSRATHAPQRCKGIW